MEYNLSEVNSILSFVAVHGFFIYGFVDYYEIKSRIEGKLNPRLPDSFLPNPCIYLPIYISAS